MDTAIANKTLFTWADNRLATPAVESYPSTDITSSRPSSSCCCDFSEHPILFVDQIKHPLKLNSYSSQVIWSPEDSESRDSVWPWRIDDRGVCAVTCAASFHSRSEQRLPRGTQAPNLLFHHPSEQPTPGLGGWPASAAISVQKRLNPKAKFLCEY